MSEALVPCAGCRRHVKADGAACPFCGAANSELSTRSLPSARLGRAATFAFGAALAAATTAGCSNSHAPDGDAGAEQDAGEEPEDAATIGPDSAIAPPYGAPPDDGGIAPLYGGAPGD